MKQIGILYLCLMCISASEKFVKADKLSLTVLYESYSPDSIAFFVQQLYPTWVKLNQYIKLELIPFGLAEQPHILDGTNNITCTGGRKECVADMLHACAVHKACHGRTTPYCSIPQLSQAMDYIYCVMQAKNQKRASDKCAESAGLRHWGINKCARQYVGNRLASHYINDPRSFKIEYVPFIFVNGKHNEKQQQEAQYHLAELVCKLIKDQCSPNSCQGCELLQSSSDFKMN